MKTKVFVTIDTEFSIGGAFADPIRHQPVGAQVVLCEIGRKSQGLGFLLDTFARFGTKATFFVEALNTHYFGDPPMRDLALRIQAAGHDVQLHLHPAWTYFQNLDWMDRLQSDPPSDHMYGRTLDQLNQWLADGIAIFERWGLGGRLRCVRAVSWWIKPSIRRWNWPVSLSGPTLVLRYTGLMIGASSFFRNSPSGERRRSLRDHLHRLGAWPTCPLQDAHYHGFLVAGN